MKLATGVLILLAVSPAALAQTIRPTTQPSTGSGDSRNAAAADEMLEQTLKPTTNPVRLLEPVSDKPVRDKTSGGGAVKPNAPPVNTLREGTFIIDRVGRLTHTDNGQAEFTFESDGKALRDPPMILLPNLKLMQMEDTLTASNRDLKFRVTGTITEYRSRNYLLLERVVQVLDVTEQLGR